MKRIKKGNLILILSIIFLIFVLFLKIYFPDRKIQPFGITILKVSSNSMKPTFKKDDYIVIKKQSEYEIGDIITYSVEEDCLVTHRIIEKYENAFITKGDNNNVADEKKIYKENILGKVIYCFRTGGEYYERAE